MPKPYPKVRLYVEPKLQESARLLIEDEKAHYLTRVMRMKEGERLALFNGADGEWAGTITELRKKELMISVEEQLRPYLPPPDGWLCFAPIKFGRIDYLVQKATELGVAKLQPVLTQYTQSERIKTARLYANAVEAAEQCERVEVPVLEEAVSLRELLASWPADRLLVVADESGEGVPATDWLRTAQADKWAILIGPEGGFSDEERALFSQVKPIVRLGLGPRILRADTAAIALLALMQCFLGDGQIAPHFRGIT